MKMWNKTGIGVVDNLLVQATKIVFMFRACSYATKRRYSAAIYRFLQFIALKYRIQKLQNIRCIPHVISYLENLKDKGRNVKYIQTEVSALQYFLKLVPNLRAQILSGKEINDLLGLAPRRTGEDRAWSKNEYELFYQKATRDNQIQIRNIITLMWLTGLRLDEAVTLKVNQINNALKTSMLILYNTKGGRQRRLNLGDDLEDFLVRILANAPRAGYAFVPDEYWDGKIHCYEKEVEHYIASVRSDIQDPNRTITGHNVKPEQRAALTAHGLRHAACRRYFQDVMEHGVSEQEALKRTSQYLGHNRTDLITKVYLCNKGGDNNDQTSRNSEKL